MSPSNLHRYEILATVTLTQMLVAGLFVYSFSVLQLPIAAEGDRVRVRERGVLRVGEQRWIDFPGDRDQLCLGEPLRAADRSVDVLSKDAADERSDPSVEQARQRRFEQARLIEAAPHGPGTGEDRRAARIDEVVLERGAPGSGLGIQDGLDLGRSGGGVDPWDA